jgi:hypothetical protein
VPPTGPPECTHISNKGCLLRLLETIVVNGMGAKGNRKEEMKEIGEE